MKLSILGLLISSTLYGCAVFDDEDNNDLSGSNLQSWYSSSTTSPSDPAAPLESSLMFQRQIQKQLTAKLSRNPSAMETASSNTHFEGNGRHITGEKLNISYYTRLLMQDLVANLKLVNATTPLAVVSFVMLDSDYNQSSLLGNQMAESLIHEIHKFGIPVIDYKTTGFIRITEQGDFAFSKDYEELGVNLAAQYIVGGTMSKHQQGYLINARIVGMESKAVVAAAQSFIPNSVADALISSVHTTNEVKNDNASAINPSVTGTSTKPKVSLVGS